MLKRRTLFILGAGASFDLGLPLGDELAARIAVMLNLRHDAGGHLNSAADKAILQALGSSQDGIDAALKVSDGLHLVHSIDTFLEIHQEDKKIVECGKLAIVRAILNAERGSKLHDDPVLKLKPARDSWMPKLFRVLNAGVVKKDSLDDLFANLSVINFNYDRCVEVFIVNALAAAYAISQEDAQKIVGEKLRIAHPYGTIGPLPWRDKGLMLGGDEQGQRLAELSAGIQTYTERIEDGDLVTDMRRMVAEAEVIVFLGFGFHKQNMELLTTPKGTKPSPWRPAIYATALGISGVGRGVVTARINEMVAHSHTMPECVDLHDNRDCAKLIDHYALVLVS
jgi:hypothetical protein